MGIKGVQGTSLLDYPGRIASLVFYGGCNLSCPYCHNPALVQTPDEMEDIAISAVVEMLQQRRGFIDGVVISGGEPTLDAQLETLAAAVKQLGLLVKLDTNGLRPQVLKRLLERDLLDYVGMDVKTAPQRYSQLHHGRVDTSALAHSVALLNEATIEVEFRTTCVPQFVAEDDIRAMGELLRGARLWVLQQFVPAHAMTERLRASEAYPAETLRRFATVAADYVAEVTVRGV